MEDKEIRHLLLLRALSAALEFSSGADQLSAETINGLGQKLGFDAQETLRLIEELLHQKGVELQWGGKVTITVTGRYTLNRSQSAAAGGSNEGHSIAALLFADVEGYSKLNEEQLKTYMTTVLPELSRSVVDPFRGEFQELNTWGDAIVACSFNPYPLIKFALNLRDFFTSRHWHGDQLPKLRVRIALHAGVVFFGEDPIRKTRGMTGTQVNLAARIEPIAKPGEAWVTEPFFKLIDPRNGLPVAFDELGRRPLAKAFSTEILYRLRRDSELPLPKRATP